MLFSSKPKGYIFEQGEQFTILARVSSLTVPMTVEQWSEFPSAETAAIDAAIAERRPQKKSGYIFAKCGVSPEHRFVRRATLDVKRLKEADYLSEVATSQFRLEVDNNAIAVVSAADGTGFDPAKPTPVKDVVFCGMPVTVAKQTQESLVARGVFPESIELSTLVSLGALVDYLKFTGSTKPTLVLEMGAQSTQSYIVSAKGIDATRPIAVGLEAMVPVVQKELGLKDEESARKLFFSNTFDFTGMGAALCKKLMKELQSSMGFYEVQTGQSIAQLVCTVLPEKLLWLESVVAAQLGVAVLQPEVKPWLDARKITFVNGADLERIDARRMAAVGLMLNITPSTDASAV